MPKHNDDGHRFDDAITRKYESLWFVVERQLMLVRSIIVYVVIPSTIVLPLTASQNYNVFRIA